MRYLALIIAALTTAEVQAFELAPRLVVSITIDQLRTDYMEAFQQLYTQGGFKRMMREGIVYDNADYPFSPVDRASAIATLSTGTTPYYNGIIAEQWLNRETLQPTYCVDDRQFSASPQYLKTSTLGDELKMSSKGQALVYAFAAQKDEAILSAGHAADGAYWLDDRYAWAGSGYYSTTLPEWLWAYEKQRRKDAKHKALTNDEVVNASLQALAATKLGQDDISDLLAITLSARKADGKPLTNWQTEMESVYMQLDNTLSRLISGIEQRISLQQVLFVITSTGYSDGEAFDYERYRVPTGTFYINRTANLLNVYLSAIYGQGRYVEQCYGNQMYLNHKLIEQKRVAMSEMLSRCQDFLVQIAGVADVYTSERLLAGNADIQKIRNGFNPTLSGDIIIEVTPGWKLLNQDTQQTYTSRAAAVPFPIIFMGFGLKAQHVSLPVTVDHIAPTLSKAIRIRAPNACSAAPLF